MNIEHELVRFVTRTAYDDLKPELLGTIKNQLLTVLGTTIAGSTQAGCQTLIDFYLSQGGKEEATILIHGSRIPAHAAALVNGVMARALDFDDALFGFDQRHHVTAPDGVARLYPPIDQSAGLHIGAQRRHAEFTHGPSPTAAPQ